LFGRGNNMLFLKDGIFSYGYHCKAARMYIVNGRQFALVNNHKYSQTTNRHLSKIKQALDKAGIPFYVVADVDELPSEYLAKAV